MNKFKLMTMIGTRPEIIRLSETIKRADECFEQILVHTGQNYDYELNQIFFDDLGLRQPNVFLNAAGKHLAETIANVISKSFDVINQYKPDALLVLGDTNSCLSAYSAKRLKVPVFHMEAGNRCFDQNVPEEINRKLVDHMSDVNMPYTEHGRRYLLSEGIRKEYIFVTGSPMKEVLEKNMKKIVASNIMDTYDLTPMNYVLLSAHREENIDTEDNFNLLMSAINEVAEFYKLKVVYSMHPRSRYYINKRNFQFHKNVVPLKPLSFTDYNALQKNAFVVLSDSGTLSEESAMLNFPAVLIRTSTERPESVDQGTIVIGGLRKESIIRSIDLVRTVFEKNQSYSLHCDYQDINISEKVVRIIQGYTPIINEYIWRKG